MNFNQQCYELLKQVPEGQVTSYKAIANALGGKAYRAVGNAMNKNPDAPQVPCHRVVGADGHLTGYAFGLDKKIEILQAEGLEIKNNKIMNLADKFFGDFKICQ